MSATALTAVVAAKPDRSAGHTRLSPSALGEAVEDEIERIRGVDGASARVLGSSKSPTLRVDVKVADDSAGEADMPDFGEEPPVESRVSSSTHAPAKGDDRT